MTQKRGYVIHCQVRFEPETEIISALRQKNRRLRRALTAKTSGKVQGSQKVDVFGLIKNAFTRPGSELLPFRSSHGSRAMERAGQLDVHLARRGWLWTIGGFDGRGSGSPRGRCYLRRGCPADVDLSHDGKEIVGFLCQAVRRRIRLLDQTLRHANLTRRHERRARETEKCT